MGQEAFWAIPQDELAALHAGTDIEAQARMIKVLYGGQETALPARKVLPGRAEAERFLNALQAEYGKPVEVFHGTKESVVQSILRNGFLPAQTDLEGAGMSVYSAFDMQTAAQYAEIKALQGSSAAVLRLLVYGPTDMRLTAD